MDGADVMEVVTGPGPTERVGIANLLEAVGGAANDTLRGSSDLGDDVVGQQMRRDLARMGGLVIYAAMIREPAAVDEANLAAIVRFARALRARIARL